MSRSSAVNDFIDNALDDSSEEMKHEDEKDLNNGLFDESFWDVDISVLNSSFYSVLSTAIIIPVEEYVLGADVVVVIYEGSSILFLTDLHFFTIKGDDEGDANILFKSLALIVSGEELYIRDHGTSILARFFSIAEPSVS
ncbi:unnamed protein product [Didymodactylos carnosus]|uniref:Uncharacterized protein n=1 Tax=Didymodactylos carnosus TaxID=1234261 RepID=A0A813R3R1_9BILA|nr:unnamed protein product [Didymodactylos carnosus]CAF0814300.1 unnamed protein product [Didymodactylos carnosus]CAF3558639.1 unnamed protein product [Didymodactylos carnosus]CAF3598242.1 unnamed protein product [Didymodactylos carnosus]